MLVSTFLHSFFNCFMMIIGYCRSLFFSRPCMLYLQLLWQTSILSENKNNFKKLWHALFFYQLHKSLCRKYITRRRGAHNTKSANILSNYSSAFNVSHQSVMIKNKERKRDCLNPRRPV